MTWVAGPGGQQAWNVAEEFAPKSPAGAAGLGGTFENHCLGFYRGLGGTPKAQV